MPSRRLRLPFVPPYDWDSMLGFLRTRRIPGVEAVDADAYRRSIEIDGTTAGFEVRGPGNDDHLRLRIVAPLAIDRRHVVERVRGLFDLDSDPIRIAQHLARDKRLAVIVGRHPGLRVPGAWDPFEMAVRAILGQQVSVRAASTFAGRLAARFGVPAELDMPGITHRFPTAAQLVDADLRQIGITGARVLAIQSLARAISTRALLLDGSRTFEATIRELSALPGIGPWTAQYIAMRALREPDAFPAGDLGVRKALTRNGKSPRPADVMRAAERWRPFRAYAVMHLWRSLA